MPKMNPAQAFDARMRHTITESSALGYYPSRFAQMINESSGVLVAKKLVASGDIHYGLQELKKLGRLDLSVESVMLEDEFRSCFTRAELEAAQWRLQQAELNPR